VVRSQHQRVMKPVSQPARPLSYVRQSLTTLWRCAGFPGRVTSLVAQSYQILTGKSGAGKSLCHEKDQEPLVWCHLDRDLDGRSDLVFVFRHVQPDRKHRIDYCLGRPRGSHGLSALEALQDAWMASRGHGRRCGGYARLERSLPVRFRKEIQTLLRKMNEKL
jgi:hypothetical protein